MEQTQTRLDGARRGALLGLVAGLVTSALGETGVAVVRQTASMADVGSVGSALVSDTPASVVLGTLLGWWGRPSPTWPLALVASIAAALVAVAHVAIQVISI